jgi:hypothetical protein
MNTRVPGKEANCVPAISRQSDMDKSAQTLWRWLPAGCVRWLGGKVSAG